MDLCNHRILRSTNFKHMIPFFLEQEMFPLYRCSFANTIGKVLCRKTTKTQTHTHICSKGVSLPMINHSCVCVWGWSLGKQQKKTRGNLGKENIFQFSSVLPSAATFLRPEGSTAKVCAPFSSVVPNRARGTPLPSSTTFSGRKCCTLDVHTHSC